MRALITGIYGQDGSYLCEQLSTKGYEVYGITRKVLSEQSRHNKEEIERNGFNPNVSEIDISDYTQLKDYILRVRPKEIYHMAALHNSSESNNIYKDRELFINNISATDNILNICFNYGIDCKVLTAGSCLMFDNVNESPQHFKSLYCSNSYYGNAKITENNLVRMYRDKGLFACTAILYNHESHRRGNSFITKKIALNMMAIKKGLQNNFEIGDINAVKDWGHAKEYTEAMQLMLLQEQPKDLILSTGKANRIKDYIKYCADILDIKHYEQYITVNDKIIRGRKNGVVLIGDNTLTKHILNWEPTLSLRDIAEDIINYEYYDC